MPEKNADVEQEQGEQGEQPDAVQRLTYEDMHRIDMMEEATDEVMEVITQMKAAFMELESRNSRAEKRLSAESGAMVSADAYLRARLEHLIDAIIPDGTAQRLFFELQWQQRRAMLIEAGRAELDAAQASGVAPTSRTGGKKKGADLWTPEQGLAVPTLRQG